MLPKQTIISDNIRLSSVYTDKFKTAALTFSLHTPLNERDYLLSLVLAGVMRRGTKNYPSMSSINKRLDELYASAIDIQSIINGNILTFCISAEILENKFTLDGTDICAEALKIISEILLSPITVDGAFPCSTVEYEKKFVKDSLEAETNNTKLYAASRIKELMSRNGTCFPTLKYMLAHIDEITPKELTEYYSHLISKTSLNIFYIGSENSESVSQKIQSAFMDFKCITTHSTASTVPEKACEFLSVTEDMPVSQGKLALGMRTNTVMGAKSNAAAIALNEIYGASPASKLFLNVRERLGLCYYCNSSYSPLSGNLTVFSGINSINREKATKEILHQFDEIKKGNISSAEMLAAKKSLEYSYMQIYDSPFSLQSFYTIRELFGIKETVDECKEKILSVTKNDICELANETLYDTCFFVNGTLAYGAEDENDCE